MLEQAINQDSELFKEYSNVEDIEALPIVNNPESISTSIEDSVDDDLKFTDKAPEDNKEESDESSDSEETENESEEQEAEEDDAESYSYKALLTHLDNEGLVEFEDSEDLEDSPELIFESVKKTIEKGIEEYKNSIPDKAKNLIEYLEKGGDIDKYLETIQKPFDLKAIDLESESDQELVMREFLKTQDYTPEEINETINDAKESLILEKQAAIAAKKLDKIFSKKSEALIAEQEQAQELQKQQYTEYISNINNTIESSSELAGLPLTNKEKEAFKNYLLAVDKQGLTQYQKEVNENPIKTQLELAYLKFMKYDFSKAMKQGETKAVKKFKDVFKRSETTVKTGRSANEIESSNNDLSAFKAFLNKNK